MAWLPKILMKFWKVNLSFFSHLYSCIENDSDKMNALLSINKSVRHYDVEMCDAEIRWRKVLVIKHMANNKSNWVMDSRLNFIGLFMMVLRLLRLLILLLNGFNLFSFVFSIGIILKQTIYCSILLTAICRIIFILW